MFTLPFAFVNKAFGIKDLGSVLITLRENDFSKVMDIGAESFSGELLDLAGLFLAVTLTSYFLSQTLRYFSAAVTVIAVVFVLGNPISFAAYRSIVPNAAHALIDVNRDFRPPETSKRPPPKQKNLILIYIESLERSYRYLPPTKEAFTKLAQIEDAGLSIRNIGQVYGTHYTAAGLTASQCGVPLLPKGIFNFHANPNNHSALIFDEMVGLDKFLPNIDCLGDILSRDGYLASYINGSNLASYSIGDMFLSHGYERVFGLNALSDPTFEPRQNIWGLDDDAFFEKAHEELAYLSKQDRPFLFSMLTVSTHGPDAFLDKKCNFPTTSKSSIPAAIFCTGNHVQKMIDEVERLGLSGNSIIVIISDHLSMRNTLESSIAGYSDPRNNFFTVLRTEQKSLIINKPGTMIDVYPTLLELLGYKLSDSKANMGVSLLSEQESLRTRFGLEQLNQAFKGNTKLAEFLWGNSFAQTAQP